MVATTDSILPTFELFTVLKFSLEVFLVLYTIVALVVIKQISLMSNTIKSKSVKYLYILAYFHLAIVVLMLVFTIIVL